MQPCLGIGIGLAEKSWSWNEILSNSFDANLKFEIIYFYL